MPEESEKGMRAASRDGDHLSLTRRAVGALSLAAVLAPAMPGTAKAAAGFWSSIHLVYQANDARARRWQQGAGAAAAFHHALTVEPALVWRRHLRAAWQQGGAVTVGCTHPDALFLLEMQARDAGQRLLACEPVAPGAQPQAVALFMQRALSIAPRGARPPRPERLLPAGGAQRPDLVQWLLADRRTAKAIKEYAA